MANAWATRPPFSHWVDYSSALRSYVDEHLAQRVHTRPEGSSFCHWFEENESALRETAHDRPRNTIVARELLPTFLSEPAGWAAVCYLRADHFQAWRAACPEALRPFVERLARVFTVAS